MLVGFSRSGFSQEMFSAGAALASDDVIGAALGAGLTDVGVGVAGMTVPAVLDATGVGEAVAVQPLSARASAVSSPAVSSRFPLRVMARP